MYPNQPSLPTEDLPILVDTHCHLDQEIFADQLPHVLAAARAVGVTTFVVPGVHPDHWGRMAALASREAGVYPAFGVHPMHADLVDVAVLSRLEQLAPDGIAIGEIGLDPSYPIPLARQEEVFRQQLRLAVRLGLPVLIHCRRAFQRTLQLMREEKASQVRGIMHAFSGSVEMAREFIRLGFLISISGTVTWANARRPLMVGRELPLESLALETDAPDMTPHPFRGRPNQPAYLTEVLRCVAASRQTTPAHIAMQTSANVRITLDRLVR